MLVISIILFALFVKASAERCITPNNEKAECVSILPDRRYCGYQHSDDYHHTKNGTNLDEFPWLALLLFRNINEVNGTLRRCGGSLISNRYVLTAAAYVTAKNFNISVIRLGDHNIEKAEDCTEEGNYFEECSDPVEDYGAEKIIPHPQYVAQSHDIALIRLDRTVTYSDYIRPICLPLPGTHFAQISDTLTISGWGAIFNGQFRNTKKKAYSRLITNEDCSERYKSYMIHKSIGRNLTDGHFCTSELNNNTDIWCVGDSGGPVMFSFKNQWHQEGIISYGHCSLGYPIIHTKVSSYLDWIERNVLP